MPLLLPIPFTVKSSGNTKGYLIIPYNYISFTLLCYALAFVFIILGVCYSSSCVLVCTFPCESMDTIFTTVSLKCKILDVLCDTNNFML